MADTQYSEERVPISFSVKESLHKRLQAKLPKYGDKSKVVTRLIEMYLDGEVKVILPGRHM